MIQYDRTILLDGTGLYNMILYCTTQELEYCTIAKCIYCTVAVLVCTVQAMQLDTLRMSHSIACTVQNIIYPSCSAARYSSYCTQYSVLSILQQASVICDS